MSQSSVLLKRVGSLTNGEVEDSGMATPLVAGVREQWARKAVTGLPLFGEITLEWEVS